jgi:drug/metabolite transporter (DMT)-like permease
MVNLTKWSGIVATLAALVVIVLPALFRVPHGQSLANLLLGEIAAIALAHSAYRASSGKQASPMAVVAAVISGLVLLVSPILLAPFDPFLSVMLGTSLLILVGGVLAGVERVRGGAAGRETGAERVSGH